MQLAADGSLLGLRAAQPGEAKRDERTLAAVRTAAPFGALEGPLDCLREQTLRIDLVR